MEYSANLNHLRREMINRDQAYYRARKYFLEKFEFDVEDLLPELSGAGMWRQFITPSFEFFVAETLCRIYELAPRHITYLKDGFTTRNPFKISLVRPKFLEFGKDSTKIRKIWLTETFRNHQLIDSILISDSLKAFEFHLHLAEKAGINTEFWDVSSFFSQLLSNAIQKLDNSEIARYFGKVFVVMHDEGIPVRLRLEFDGERFRSGKLSYSLNEVSEMASEGLVYPSMETYYSEIFYFLPGILLPEFIQIEAIFETADREIFIPAREGFKRCREVTGFYPLVIPIPDFNILKEFRFTKNPACVTICKNLDEIFECMNAGGEVSFYRTAYSIGEKLLSIFLNPAFQS